MAKYIYSAVLTPDSQGGYSVHFPDIAQCYTQGGDLTEALDMAKDALSLLLMSYEDDGFIIPHSTAQRDIRLKNNQLLSLVSVDTSTYRASIDKSSVKKTLTIPRWLNTIAEKNKVNFSAVLQEALIEKLKL